MRKSRSRFVLLGCVLALLSSSAASERGSTSPAARVSKGNSSSEYWDAAALFESGHRVFARFSISNEGPGDDTGYAIGQVVFPDGTVVPFTNGRRKGRWQLSEDGLRMEIGSSVLDLRKPVRKLEVDKNTAGIKLFLRFEARSMFWRASYPTSFFGIVNTLDPTAPVPVLELGVDRDTEWVQQPSFSIGLAYTFRY